MVFVFLCGTGGTCTPTSMISIALWGVRSVSSWVTRAAVAKRRDWLNGMRAMFVVFGLRSG